MNIDKLERFRYVLSLTDCTEDEIKSQSRKSQINKTRQMLMYFCNNELRMGLKETAIICGRSDHSTAHHSVSKFTGILALPHKGNYEAQRYKLILNKYREKYGQMPKNHYICADKILDNMTAELIELNAKQNQNPMQTVVNNAKKSQLEKYINIVNELKNEHNRQMDKGAAYIGTTAINVQSQLYGLQNQSC
jgi:hypothetical protein